MKCAFLILAHTDPVQLRRLVHALDYPNFDVFIHVDLKQDIRSFEFDQYSLRYSKLTVLDNRYRVFWGDISIVHATLAMYRAAFASGDYDRFVTLSGLDYPLLSNEIIAERLSDHSVEFIMGNTIETKEYHKVEKFHFGKLGRVGKVLTALLSTLRIRKSRYITVGHEKWDIYFAPQWHALSRKCVEYILHSLDNHPHILKYFANSYAPDELLIPTILFNSEKFRSKALRSTFPAGTHYNDKTAIHYINYEPFVEVFRENRYPELISSQKLFCRKVKTGVSDTLMDMIDKAKQSTPAERTHQNGHQT